MGYPAPKWLDDAVFYQIYPQSFFDSNGDGIGDLPGIMEKLDYVRSLGVTAIWLNPCFDSPFYDAGYDVRDFYKVAPRYGTNADLKRLFDEAHQKGLRVLLDLVAGHTSLDCAWFQKSSDNRRNRYSNYYMWSDGWADDARGFRFISGYPSRRDGYYMINFFYCQPALNYGFVDPVPGCPWQLPVNHPDVKAVRQELKKVMKFYLDMGCDGFRVDMASSLVRANNPALRQQGLVDLWQDYRSWMKKNHPEAILVAEWSNPPAAIAAGFDLDFILWNEGQSYGNQAYAKLLRGERKRNLRNSPVDVCSYFDLSGKGSVLPYLGELARDLEGTAKGGGYIAPVSGNHDQVRCRIGRTPEEMKVFFTFLFSLPGCPFLYYGDEIGMDYVKGLPNCEGGYLRCGSRTPMQWEPGAKAGFSTAAPRKFYLPLAPAKGRSNVEEQNADPESLLNYVRQMIALRRSSKALWTKGKFKVLACEKGGYPLVYERTFSKEKYIIGINPSGRAVQTLLRSGGTPEVVMGCGKSEWRAGTKGCTLKLGGVSAVVYRF